MSAPAPVSRLAALWGHRWLVLGGIAVLGLGIWFAVGRLIGPG